MKVVIAPDSYKGSLGSPEVADAIEEGLASAIPEIEADKVPMADGGEGTTQALVAATGGRLVERDVIGPLGEERRACFGVLGDGKTGVVEMASASGLTLVPEGKRNPLITTTYGTGQLIQACMDYGCDTIIVGIGGSATNDGGAGMASALGVRFLDSEGKEVGPGGGGLLGLDRIDISGLDPRIREGRVRVVVACDVDNPLLGPRGASRVYGPQKGATPDMVEQLESALSHYADVLERDLNKPIRDLAGGGAAGGLGAGLVAFLGAELRPGVDIVAEAVHLPERMAGASLAITGEGRIDFQTVFGKTPIGVARAAKRYGVPVVALAGSVGEGAEAVYEHGIDAVISIVRAPVTLDYAMAHARELIRDAAAILGRLLLIGARVQGRCNPLR